MHYSKVGMFNTVNLAKKRRKRTLSPLNATAEARLLVQQTLFSHWNHTNGLMSFHTAVKNIRDDHLRINRK